MKEIYELFYKDQLIGEFIITDNKYIDYKYVGSVDLEIYDFLKKDNKCNINEFPFIENRIINIKKFNLTTLQYPNTSYVLKLKDY